MHLCGENGISTQESPSQEVLAHQITLKKITFKIGLSYRISNFVRSCKIALTIQTFWWIPTKHCKCLLFPVWRKQKMLRRGACGNQQVRSGRWLKYAMYVRGVGKKNGWCKIKAAIFDLDFWAQKLCIRTEQSL